MIKIKIFIIFILLSITSYGQKFIGDEGEIDQILKNISLFSNYLINSDHINVGKIYSVDAKIFPNNEDIIVGRDHITDYWKNSNQSLVVAHKILPQEIKVIGNEAYDFGYYEGTTRHNDGKENSWKGKYVIVWKKVENDWKIYVDIWNRIAE